MNFDELCKDFSDRNVAVNKRPGTEIEVKPLVSIAWENGLASSNDLLCKYLHDNGIDYLRDFGGTVWFVWDGIWTRSKVRYNRDTNMAHFSRCVFAESAA